MVITCKTHGYHMRINMPIVKLKFLTQKKKKNMFNKLCFAVVSSALVHVYTTRTLSVRCISLLLFWKFYNQLFAFM